MAHPLPLSPELAYRRLRRGLNIGMTIAAAIALCSLICEHGFYNPPINVFWLHLAQIFVLACFLTDKLVRFLIAPDRSRYLRRIWIHLVIIGLVVAAIALASQLGYNFASVGMVYVTILQAYILAVLGLNLMHLNTRLSESGLPPARLLVMSFLIVIFCGAGLLLLPRSLPRPDSDNPDSRPPPISIADALFTAVSATCVTGLVVLDTGKDFSLFGQTVILAMIQLGALGIMMFGTTFALMIGRTIGLREGTFYQGLLSENIFGKIGRMLKFIVLTTIVLELLGAALMLSLWPADFSPCCTV